jgi:histidinol-phosphate/aromatic aminotransferase/cobyric acid decarboxylase-like protein
VRDRREELIAEIQSIPGLSVFPGEANFLLVRSNHKKMPATELARLCLADGIAIRICDNFTGLDERFFRIAVRTAEENCRLCHSLRKALDVSEGVPRNKEKI